jgi:Response regulators consisting of a CheY-like receiver domain and a winged-helix DNA-binding domain
VKAYEIPIDRQHIDKVVYNLLSNAFKYTPTKGNITVSVRVDEGHVNISVQDTGVGIPKEKQPELFQRFMQSTFASDSIGIGLHLTKALVEVHHGSVHFEENKPQGSVFVVELPAERSVYKDSDFLKKSELKPVATNQSSPVYRELAGEPMNDRTILVVEDDSDIVTMLKQTLGRFFHVSVAMDGAAALDMLNQEDKPDLIVSDVLMPVMDGYELTRRVRSNPATQTIPIVLLTALTNEEKRLKGIEHGADAYLTKPFETKLLISTCRQIIGQRDLLRRQAVDNPEVTTIAPPEIIVEERDKHLLSMMNAWLYDHISDPMLSVDQVAEAMGYRRSIFFKKVKALTGQIPADYIKTLRMNRAAELLQKETITVAEVCYKVGISDPHYFTKVFKQKFGISPKNIGKGNIMVDIMSCMWF